MRAAQIVPQEAVCRLRLIYLVPQRLRPTDQLLGPGPDPLLRHSTATETTVERKEERLYACLLPLARPHSDAQTTACSHISSRKSE